MKKKCCVYILIFLIFLTSSFDIFLNFNVAGFNLRISNVLSIFFIFIMLINIVKRGKFILTRNSKYLIIWTIIVMLFTTNTQLPYINIIYNIWLIFYVLIIFCFINLEFFCKNSKQILQIYIYSFFIMASFGIIEFIIGILGFNFPFITQWWMSKKIPRINGFSYEPSYYATYLLLGWVFCRSLIQNKVKFLKNIYIIFSVITIAIVISSSRIVIFFIVIYEVLIYIKNFLKCKNKKYLILITFFGIMLVFFMCIIFKTGKLDKFLVRNRVEWNQKPFYIN